MIDQVDSDTTASNASPATSAHREASARVHNGPSQRIFLFVNSSSGGRAAAVFTDAGLEYAVLREPFVTFSIFELREGERGKKRGFLELKTYIDEDLPDGRLPFVVVCGGDGSVMWAISEIHATNIDINKLVLGVVPYGTGNDFARALEWEHYNAVNPFVQQMKMMKQLCSDWVKAKVVLHDIWEVDISLHSEGRFMQVDEESRVKKVLMESEGRELRHKTFAMCNYFSVGVEARIGIGFDKNRTAGQTRNKMTYLAEGIKKMTVRRTVPVQKLVSNMITEEFGREDLVFTTENTSHVHLKPCMSLIAVNIPSFGAGLNLWKNSNFKNLGIEGTLDEKYDGVSGMQMLGDGKLEFVSFAGVFALGAEQAIGGHSLRVFQGSGPFTINFRPLTSDVRTYFQVDGEFYVMTCPQKVVLRHIRKVKVLANSAGQRDCFIQA